MTKLVYRLCGVLQAVPLSPLIMAPTFASWVICLPSHADRCNEGEACQAVLVEA